MTNHTNGKYVLFSLLLCTMGCQQGNRNHTTERQNEKNKCVENIIQKDFPVYADFNQITNIGSFNIHLSEGPYKITVTGDSTTLTHITYDIDGGSLTLSIPSEENEDINTYNMTSNVSIDISLPKINILTNCGSGTIDYVGSLNTDKLYIGGIGSGWIHIDSISCTDFKYESTRETDAQFRFINCESAIVLAAGVAKTQVNVKASRSAAFVLSGKCKATINTEAPFTDIIASDEANSSFIIASDTMSAVSNGLSTTQLSGVVHKYKIKQLSESIIKEHIKGIKVDNF